MNFDNLIDAADSRYDNWITEVLVKTSIRKIESIINAYASNLINIYFNIGHKQV